MRVLDSQLLNSMSKVARSKLFLGPTALWEVGKHQRVWTEESRGFRGCLLACLDSVITHPNTLRSQEKLLRHAGGRKEGRITAQSVWSITNSTTTVLSRTPRKCRSFR